MGERKVEPVGWYDTEPDGGEWAGFQHRVSHMKRWETDVGLYTADQIRGAVEAVRARYPKPGTFTSGNIGDAKEAMRAVLAHLGIEP